MTLIERDSYTIIGEFTDFGVILHGTVSDPWTPSLRRAVQADIRVLVQELAQPVWAFHWVDDPEHDDTQRKFVRLMGGVFSHLETNSEGKEAEFYRFPLN